MAKTIFIFLKKEKATKLCTVHQLESPNTANHPTNKTNNSNFTTSVAHSIYLPIFNVFEPPKYVSAPLALPLTNTHCSLAFHISDLSHFLLYFILFSCISFRLPLILCTYREGERTSSARINISRFYEMKEWMYVVWQTQPFSFLTNVQYFRFCTYHGHEYNWNGRRGRASERASEMNDSIILQANGMVLVVERYSNVCCIVLYFARSFWFPIYLCVYVLYIWDLKIGLFL